MTININNLLVNIVKKKWINYEHFEKIFFYIQ